MGRAKCLKYLWVDYNIKVDFVGVIGADPFDIDISGFTDTDPEINALLDALDVTVDIKTGCLDYLPGVDTRVTFNSNANPGMTGDSVIFSGVAAPDILNDLVDAGAIAVVPTV